jgi:hypothetical protein
VLRNTAKETFHYRAFSATAQSAVICRLTDLIPSSKTVCKAERRVKENRFCFIAQVLKSDCFRKSQLSPQICNFHLTKIHSVTPVPAIQN